MLRHPARLAALLVVALAAPALAGQQGSIQVSSSTQVVTGDELRTGGQAPVSPDFLFHWVQPGFRFGTLEVTFGATRRGDRAVPGRTAVALRDVHALGLSWSFTGGDTTLTPQLSSYHFTNLFAPEVNFRGGAVYGANERTTVAITAGRAVALRNIFGSDPDVLGQTIVSAQASHWATGWLQVSAHAARVRTSDLGGFSYFVTDSDSGGVGATLRVTPSFQFVTEGGYARYRRVGSDRFERGASGLVGALWSHRRGWLQINAERFSPGDLPVLNYQYRDREDVFVGGEYDLGPAHAFGGGTVTRTNLDPAAASRAGVTLPQTTIERVWGGIRLPVASHSYATLRYEGGGRRARTPGLGQRSDSDRGVAAFEWRSSFPKWNLFSRYQRRSNVDLVAGFGTYTQHDAMLQAFYTPRVGRQFFGAATWTRQEANAGGGQQYWEVSAGGQFQLPRRDLYLRAEATASQNLDLAAGLLTPRRVLNFGLSGRLTPRTSLAVDFFVDRTPLSVAGVSPYLTRSMIRFVYTLPTGSASAPSGLGGFATAPRAARGTGTVAGSVFVDWNANGQHDPDEEPAGGVTMLLDKTVRVTTGPDGRFEFSRVPVGTSRVGIDVSALPVDYDIPAIASLQVEVARNASARAEFGVVPLGAIEGAVARDANGNGVLDEGDEPIDGAVLVLDGGARSELARGGAFRFDAVDSGPHTVRLLLQSLPPGAAIQGAAQVDVLLGRDRLGAKADFLVKLERRAEIRKVFPATGAAPPPAAPRPAAPAPPRAAPARPAAPIETEAAAPSSAGPFAVQAAAVSRGERAGTLAANLRSQGWDAYVVQPGPNGDGFYRVRVGTFADRGAADRAAAGLSAALGTAARVVREPEGGGSPYRVQVAALAREDRAQTFVERLAGLGYDGYVLRPEAWSADRLFRVRVGPFADRAAADRAAAAIARGLGATPWVTRDAPPVAATPRGRAPRRSPRGAFVIQIGALSRPESADLLRARAAALGYDTEVTPPEPGAATPLYRVRIRGYRTRADANAAAPAVERALGVKTWVTEETGTRRRAAPRAETDGPFVVQVAALSEADRADALVERLKALGYAPYLRLPQPGGRDRLYRVGVGPFETLDAARQAGAAIERQLGVPVWITRGTGD